MKVLFENGNVFSLCTNGKLKKFFIEFNSEIKAILEVIYFDNVRQNRQRQVHLSRIR